MSNHLEQKKPCESLQGDLQSGQQEIIELSDEGLEQATGGFNTDSPTVQAAAIGSAIGIAAGGFVGAGLGIVNPALGYVGAEVGAVVGGTAGGCHRGCSGEASSQKKLI